MRSRIRRIASDCAMNINAKTTRPGNTYAKNFFGSLPNPVFDSVSPGRMTPTFMFETLQTAHPSSSLEEPARHFGNLIRSRFALSVDEPLTRRSAQSPARTVHCR